jgi:hypothetical protein
MSIIVDYGTLKTAIADYINRKDLTVRIPDFISFGEGDIFRGFMTRKGNISLRCRDNIEEAELVPVEGVVAIPSDYRELIEVTMAARGLKPMSEQFYNRARLYTGQTSAYSQRGDSWYQYPQSDTDDTFDVKYFADYSGTLVNDTDTNPILTALPEIYLFAALAEAETYIKNDARSATWGNKLESNIRAANATYRRSLYSGATPAQRTQYREVQTTRSFNHGTT